MEQDEINELELLGHNAWLAQERMRIGGWLLRADHGVTRRANSVLPLGPPGLDLSTAIDFAIEFYQSRDLIPRFQVTEASYPKELDAELSERGFSQVFFVEVWTANIDSLLNIDPGCPTGYSHEFSDEWVNAYLDASGHNPSTMQVRQGIMERTEQPRVFVHANIDDTVAAVGYGVAEGSWLGIFAIATLPDKRDAGAATAVNHALGIWGKNHGVEHVYLQVETNNDTAKKLYSKLGFTHGYTYWYRKLE